MGRDLERLARRLAGKGPSTDDPEEALALLDEEPPTSEEARALSKRLLTEGCYRVARELARRARGEEEGRAFDGTLLATDDLCAVLIDLQYGSAPKDEEPAAAPLNPADEATTAINPAGHVEVEFPPMEDIGFDEESKTIRWSVGRGLNEVHPFDPQPAEDLTPAFDPWYTTVADAARAVRDGKGKLAQALLQGLARRESRRPEPRAALGLLALADGDSKAGVAVIQQAVEELGQSPALEAARHVLEAHSGELLDRTRARKLAVQSFVTLLAGMAADLL